MENTKTIKPPVFTSLPDTINKMPVTRFSQPTYDMIKAPRGTVKQGKVKGKTITVGNTAYTWKKAPKTTGIERPNVNKLVRFIDREATRQEKSLPIGGSYTVVFNIDTFLRLCHPNMDKELATTDEVELKKAKQRYIKQRQRLISDLNFLLGVQCRFSYKQHGKGAVEVAFNYYSSCQLYRRSRDVAVTLTPEYAQYLFEQKYTRDNDSLYAIDGNGNEYRVACALQTHYAMYSNHKKGTANRLTVKSLLEKTNLPTINSNAARKYGWRVVIKDKFENILSYLQDSGLLASGTKGWHYCGVKGVEVDGQQAMEQDQLEGAIYDTRFKTYKEWENANIEYTLTGQDVIDKAYKDHNKDAKKANKKKEPDQHTGGDVSKAAGSSDKEATTSE